MPPIIQTLLLRASQVELADKQHRRDLDIAEFLDWILSRSV